MLCMEPSIWHVYIHHQHIRRQNIPSPVVISSSTFFFPPHTDNLADWDGGVACFSAMSRSSLSLVDSSFANNRAGWSGGIVASESSLDAFLVSVLNSNLTANQATRYGGVMYGTSGAYNVSITNSTVADNFAARSGGVVYLNNAVSSSVVSTGATFIGNSAQVFTC